MINPEIGFTSSVIQDPKRFVGRSRMIRDCIRALSNPHGLIAIYGKRGVGKSSLLRQVQQIALGDYEIAKLAGVYHEKPERPRKYVTVYYQCDSMITNGQDLLGRLCNDQNEQDGLLRLVPNEGKEIVEFSRGGETQVGIDLKVVNWGEKGIDSKKYARVVPNDTVQTFRNYVQAIVTQQVKKRMKRDSLLILLDEFDVIADKTGIGSLIKSLSSDEVKFGVCGIGTDTTALIRDHASVERLLEQGAIQCTPMPYGEIVEIFNRAEELFDGKVRFDQSVKDRVAEVSQGYPYFAQMLGKECVTRASEMKVRQVNDAVFDSVMDDVKRGKLLPTLESAYKRAIGTSEDRQILLHLLAEQPEDSARFDVEVGHVFLRNIRREAEGFEISNLDQNLPRLLDPKYGPALNKVPDSAGVYEFTNPVLRLYVRLRAF